MHLLCTPCSGSVCLLKALVSSGYCLKGIKLKNFAACFSCQQKEDKTNNEHYPQLMSNVTMDKVRIICEKTGAEL